MIEKYLNRYAEKEIFSLPTLTHTFDVGISVPCLNENATLFSLLKSLSDSAVANHVSALCVLVVNHRDSHSDTIKKENLSLFSQLNCISFPSLTLLPVDRCSLGKEFPPKQGVGLARKIGADILLKLYSEGKIRSPWFRTTDGDVSVPLDYLAPLTWKSAVSGFGTSPPIALTFAFEHTFDRSQEREMRALKLYEDFLHYYVTGLKWAGSPYAFYAIGSTLAFTAEAYAMVRGFPKREAAEDFHFLNKIARVGRIAEVNGHPIQIAQRRSQRVPFGTGRSTITIAELLANQKPYLVFDPDSFSWLKDLLAEIDHLSHHKHLPRFTQAIRQPWLQCLEELGVIKDFENVLTLSKDRNVTWRHLNTAFDGLKTIQSFRKLSHTALPLIELNSALIKIGKLVPTMPLQSRMGFDYGLGAF